MKFRLYIAALHAALLCILLAVSPAGSGSMTLLGVGPPPVVAGGGCSQATTFLARTSGLSGTETTAYTNLICGLVTDGVYASLDALYIFATNTTTTANLNLLSTSFGLTQTGSVTFTADHGYTGDGTTGFLETGFTPSTGGTNFVLNAGSLGIYVQNSRTALVDETDIGVNSSGNIAWIIPLHSSGNAFWDINDGALNTFATPTNAQGQWIATRTAASGAGATSYYKNGNTTAVASATTASTGLPANSILILADHSGSTPERFSADQLSAAFIGGGLSSANMALVASRINAYMTALSINVY